MEQKEEKADLVPQEGRKYEGWRLDEKEVKGVISKMGFSPQVPIPNVIIIKEKGEYPEAHQTTKGDYFITIPEGELKWVGEEKYTLGPEALLDLRHELAHYESYLEGFPIGSLEDPYQEALKEIRMDFRAGHRSTSRELVFLILGLSKEYNISLEEALNIVSRAAKDGEISSKVISRIKKLVSEYTEGG